MTSLDRTHEECELEGVDSFSLSPLPHVGPSTSTYDPSQLYQTSQFYQQQAFPNHGAPTTYPSWPGQFGNLQAPVAPVQSYQPEMSSIPAISTTGFATSMGAATSGVAWQHAQPLPAQPPVAIPSGRVQSSAVGTTEVPEQAPIGIDSSIPCVVDGSLSPALQRVLTEPPPDVSGEPEAHSQLPRHPFDIYTARWIRGKGSDREGWCPFCLRWRKLKNSGFWYDKTYGHGISRFTGWFFDKPVGTRALEPSPTTMGAAAASSHSSPTSAFSSQEVPGEEGAQSVQGQCGQCGSWIDGPLYAAKRANRPPGITTDWSRQWLEHNLRCQAQMYQNRKS